MNIRKLMARINPPTKPIPQGAGRTRFRGGSPSLQRALEEAGKYKPTTRNADGSVVMGELVRHSSTLTRTVGTPTRGSYNPDAITGIDIGHALGHVHDAFARELFCHLWWEDGAARTRVDLEREIHLALMNEFARRKTEAVAARLQLHIVETNAARWRADDRAELRRAKDRAESANKGAWPDRLADYPALVVAVLNELQAPNHCVMCEGRGVLWAGDVRRDCGGCAGTGTIPVADRQRADAMDKALSTYQAQWRSPYEWLHRRCWEAEGRAASALRRALLDDTKAVA